MIGMVSVGEEDLEAMREIRALHHGPLNANAAALDRIIALVAAALERCRLEIDSDPALELDTEPVTPAVIHLRSRADVEAFSRARRLLVKQALKQALRASGVAVPPHTDGVKYAVDALVDWRPNPTAPWQHAIVCVNATSFRDYYLIRVRGSAVVYATAEQLRPSIRDYTYTAGAPVVPHEASAAATPPPLAPTPPPDPLDRLIDCETLRDLLELDEQNRRDGGELLALTTAQRAAVSAYSSEQLRERRRAAEDEDPAPAVSMVDTSD